MEAIIYISAFLVYGGVLAYPEKGANASAEWSFLSDNHMLLSLLNLVSYVLFGILLAVLVLAIHQRLKRHAPNFSKLAFVFGVIWVGLVIASGMIANVGLNSILETGNTDPEKAMQIWTSVSIVTEGLGGGNEIIGGLWALCLSILALQHELFSKPLNFLGLLVGAAGIATVYPLDVFTEIFGLSQIVWFLWIGIYMIRKPSITVA